MHHNHHIHHPSLRPDDIEAEAARLLNRSPLVLLLRHGQELFNMPVQHHVLNWLYSVLTSEYHDVNRTYNDVAQVLAQYPSLSPRTDVHTFPNGHSSLLVHLSGTIPVQFRGTTYRFPISIWVPHAYPKEPPLAYVMPTQHMMVRPGQHVDPQGQVYHPYLNHWTSFWDKSSVLDFLAILTDVFAKEPPVISRQPQSQPARSQPQDASPPPVPPLPPDIAPPQPSISPVPVAASSPSVPPPPPPSKSSSGTFVQSSQPSLPKMGPPAELQPPPLPPSRPSSHTTGPEPQAQLGNSTPSRYETVPPLPPHPADLRQQLPTRPAHDQAPFAPHKPAPSQGAQSIGSQRPTIPPYYQNPPQSHPPPAHGLPLPARPMMPQARAPPPPDLLDEPLPTSGSSPAPGAAPPVPLNPEKDSILRELARALYLRRQTVRKQNESSLSGLVAQRQAMQSASATLQTEMGFLNQLSALLASNTHILHDALHKADAVIEDSRRHPAPDIDELLVAPTVVANQLYTLVAEEKALGDTIFVVGRAMEKGRISTAVFAKTTRSLAREWYLKKALVRKIARGMGLAM